jgi:hypothetical protein
MRDVVLIETPQGEAARRLSIALLAADGLVWSLAAVLISHAG